MKEWRRYNVKSDRSDNLPKNLMEAVSQHVFIRCKDFASLTQQFPLFYPSFFSMRLFGTWSSCWNACPFLWITLHCYVTYKVPHYANNSMHARVCIDCNFSSCELLHAKLERGNSFLKKKKKATLRCYLARQIILSRICDFHWYSDIYYFI